MSLRTVVLVVAAGAVVTAAYPGAGGRCGAASEAHVIGRLARNASGHWSATVRMEQHAHARARDTPLLLEAAPSVRRCGAMPIITLTLTITGEPIPPSPGYQKTEWIRGYYKVHEEKVSWEEAKTRCEEENAHLLVLNSQEEAEAIKKLIKQHPGIHEWAHVGFTDKDKEGEYVTIFGESFAEAGYSTWNAGEPSNSKQENCGSIRVSTMGLNDLPCTSYAASFICEQSV